MAFEKRSLIPQISLKVSGNIENVLPGILRTLFGIEDAEFVVVGCAVSSFKD